MEEGAGDGGSPLSERGRGRSKHGLRGTGTLAAPPLSSSLLISHKDHPFDAAAACAQQ